jgi:hypothetical protein
MNIFEVWQLVELCLKNSVFFYFLLLLFIAFFLIYYYLATKTTVNLLATMKTSCDNNKSQHCNRYN